MNHRYPQLIILAMTLCMGTFPLRAQDLHFSLFNLYPATLNPALTGTMPSDWRLSAIHRQQWKGISSMFASTGIGGEYAFQDVLLPKNRLGLGIYLTDNTLGNILENLQTGISVAYHHSFGPNDRAMASFGIQGSFERTRIDMTKLQFGNQYEFFQFNPDLGSGEPFNTDQWNNITFSTGTRFSYRFSSRFLLSAGAAAFHWIGSEKSLYEDVSSRNTRWSVHGQGTYVLSPKLEFHPQWQFLYQRAAYNTLLAAQWSYRLPYHQDISLWGGIGYRYRDALVFYAGLAWKELKVMAAYDLTVSSLKKVGETPLLNGRNLGAFEVGLTWSGWVNPAGGKPVAIPCKIF